MTSCFGCVWQRDMFVTWIKIRHWGMLWNYLSLQLICKPRDMVLHFIGGMNFILSPFHLSTPSIVRYNDVCGSYFSIHQRGAPEHFEKVNALEGTIQETLASPSWLLIFFTENLNRYAVILLCSEILLFLPLIGSLYSISARFTPFVRSPPFFHGMETHFAV